MQCLDPCLKNLVMQGIVAAEEAAAKATRTAAIRGGPDPNAEGTARRTGPVRGAA